MSGAVMLWMLATAGITFGWTPDGGNGVKYIIQIPPEQVQQVARTGEISSQIPAEIRGHVSEVVIRIGNGSLPRVTPTHLSNPRSSGSSLGAASQRIDLIAAGDSTPVPIPRIDGPAEVRPIGSLHSSSTAMMKPAPQGSGMNLPGGFGMTPATNPPSGGQSSSGQPASGPGTQFGQPNPPPNFAAQNSQGQNFGGQSFGGQTYPGQANPVQANPGQLDIGQAARDTATNLTNDLRNTFDTQRQQVQQNINATADRFGDTARENLQSATNNMRDAAGQFFNPSASQNQAVNNAGNQAAATASDDPRARLAQPNAGFTNAPSANDPISPPDFATSQSRAEAPSTNSPSSPSTAPQSGYSRNAAASTAANPDTGEEWFDLRNGLRRRPSTDPVETAMDARNASSSSSSSSNFGRLPTGLQPETAIRNPRTTQAPNPSVLPEPEEAAFVNDPRRASSAASVFDYDRNLTPAQAALLPSNGYSFDAENYPVDREGYRLDRHGRRVDRQGQLLTAVDSMVDPRFDPRADPRNFNVAQAVPDNQSPIPNASYQNGGFYGNPSNPGMSPMLTPGMPGYGQVADTRLVGLPGSPNNTIRSATDGFRAGEDDLRSASDAASRSGRYAELEPSLTEGSRKSARTPEQIAAQPIFNALLLLSIVANVYLLVWLKNLRLQFRDMVASKRAASSGGTLAAGL